MESYIFISYSSKDAGLAHQLVEYLEQNGVRCWIAPRNIPSGRDYTDIIDVAIKGCNGIILIYSDHSAQSVWVKKEITLGVGHKKNIIPFKITRSGIEGGMNFMLNNLQWIDAASKPTEKFKEVLDGINRADNQLQTQTTGELVVKKDEKKRRLLPYGIAGGIVLVAITAFLIAHPKGQKEGVQELVDTVKVEMPSETEKDSSVEKVPVKTVAEQTKKESDKNKGREKSVETKKKDGLQQNVDEAKKQEEIKQEEETSTEIVAEEKPEVKQPENKVEKPVDHTKDTFNKAVRLYNTGRYKDALRYFEQVKKEKPQYPEIDQWMKMCNEKIDK